MRLEEKNGSATTGGARRFDFLLKRDAELSFSTERNLSGAVSKHFV